MAVDPLYCRTVIGDLQVHGPVVVGYGFNPELRGLRVSFRASRTERVAGFTWLWLAFCSAEGEPVDLTVNLDEVIAKHRFHDAL